MEPEPSYPPLCYQILSEFAFLWKRKLESERDLKRSQFGGKIVIDTNFFSSTLSRMLFDVCSLGENPSLLQSAELWKLNVLFGNEWYSTRYKTGESWLVKSVEVKYLSSGKLRLTFNTLCMNVLGEVLTVV